jgi:hypothetical protein
MFRKEGRRFPGASNDGGYAGAIADALRTELGQSHRATKTLMKWTGASDRTAKNWLSGCCGPSGGHLVQLARESDTVLAAVLALSGRHRHMLGADLLSIRAGLASALVAVDQLLALQQPGAPFSAGAGEQAAD